MRVGRNPNFLPAMGYSFSQHHHPSSDFSYGTSTCERSRFWYLILPGILENIMFRELLTECHLIATSWTLPPFSGIFWICIIVLGFVLVVLHSYEYNKIVVNSLISPVCWPQMNFDWRRSVILTNEPSRQATTKYTAEWGLLCREMSNFETYLTEGLLCAWRV